MTDEEIVERVREYLYEKNGGSYYRYGYLVCDFEQMVLVRYARMIGREEGQARVERIIDLVDKQAGDVGLWFITATASGAYLQQELRKLHALIETNLKKQEA